MSAAYVAFRPHYPAALFAAIAERCPQRSLCVDVGCGSGQAVEGLRAHFQSVLGVDPSASQIAHAKQFDRVTYAVAGAETFAACLPAPHTADCVTVAQAIHWFDMPKFMQQVELALKPNPGALLAFWSYPLCRVVSHPAVDELLREVDGMLMSDGYWPPERRHVDNHYADIVTPSHFPPTRWHVDKAVFPVEKTMSLDAFVAYMATMSGVARYKEKWADRDLLGDFKQRAATALSAGAPSTADVSSINNGDDATSLRLPQLTVVFDMETYFASRVGA